ncbi:toll-like receptor 4 [Haliotis cracherodii]|uniref:toll-like receptor 4 n=1 Tax=Haliotis cracherodii TaxID=6455 RepID=UPI0039E9C950
MHRCVSLLLAWVVLSAAVSILPSMVHALKECHPCTCYRRQGEITADCTNRKLSHIPAYLPQNITKLEISCNGIAVLNETSFKRYSQLRYLNMSFNKLDDLDKETLLYLPDLINLDLHSNHLRLDDRSFPPGLFRKQKKLQVLLAHNTSRVGDLDMKYPDATFSDLISLKVLRLDGLDHPVFGEGFRKLTLLTTLVLSGSGGTCTTQTLSNTTFINLPTIRFLDLSNCEITKIQPFTFVPLRQINTLDLSQNVDLTFGTLSHGMYGTVNSSLKVLKLNRVHRRRGAGIVVSVKDVQFLTGSQLQELHVDENQIELLDLSTIASLPSSIKVISAKNNNFIFGLYMLGLSTLVNLTWADVSFQHQSHVNPFSVGEKRYQSTLVTMIQDGSFDPDTYTCTVLGQSASKGPCDDDKRQNQAEAEKDLDINLDLPLSMNNKPEGLPPLVLTFATEEITLSNYSGWPGNFTMSVPPNGEFLNISNSKMNYVIPRSRFGPNKLKVLDMSYNFFTRWEGPILGLNALQYVDLSHNYCDFIGDNFCKNFPSLRVLNISSNYLGYSLKESSINGIPTLEVLDISDNKINHLPTYMFKNMAQLVHLNLSYNFLTTWDADIRHIGNLTLLDISHNLFEEVPPTLRSELDAVSVPGMTLLLEGNPLKCNCDTLPSLKWMSSHLRSDQHYTCTTSDKKIVALNIHTITDMTLRLDKSCASYVGVMIGSLSVVMIAVSLGVAGLVYRYRWKLRYLYYLTRSKYNRLVPDGDEGFEYDGFISYADEDRQIVTSDMRQRLEDTEGLKLCIHDRDFLPGEAIAANILDAIRSSRKTVVLLSRNFLRSPWCKYELEMTKIESIYTGRQTLVVVMLEDIPVKDLPQHICDIIAHESYIEYTNDEEGKEVFWQGLKRAMLSNVT